MGKWKLRKRVRFPKRGGTYVALNFTQNGFSSWSLVVGRWSWNSRTRRHRVDTPGPGYWESDRY